MRCKLHARPAARAEEDELNYASALSGVNAATAALPPCA